MVLIKRFDEQNKTLINNLIKVCVFVRCSLQNSNVKLLHFEYFIRVLVPMANFSCFYLVWK